MTTPQQPGDDLNVEAEVIEDLDVTRDSESILGGDGKPIHKPWAGE